MRKLTPIILNVFTCLMNFLVCGNLPHQAWISTPLSNCPHMGSLLTLFIFWHPHCSILLHTCPPPPWLWLPWWAAQPSPWHGCFWHPVPVHPSIQPLGIPTLPALWDATWGHCGYVTPTSQTPVFLAFGLFVHLGRKRRGKEREEELCKVFHNRSWASYHSYYNYLSTHPYQ